MRIYCVAAFVSFCSINSVFAAPVSDGRESIGQRTQRKLFVGLQMSGAVHGEEGLDTSKGEYTVGYSTLGGSAVVQYHIAGFYLEGGIGLMKLMRLKVNELNIGMSNRSQWHLPLFAHMFYEVNPLFSPGVGITHLTELPMYVDGQKVPESSYHQIFLDFAAQLTPQITKKIRMTITFILGFNLLPGRQHTYSIGDLLHVRFQLNIGALYRVF